MGDTLPVEAPKKNASPILNDDLSDAELDQIFRERRAKIEQDFRLPTDEPTSFLRPRPFAFDPKDKLAQRLGEAPFPVEDEYVPRSPKRAASGVFLTSTSEIADDTSRLERRSLVRQKLSASTPTLPTVKKVPSSPAGVVLPPIRPSSRGSSSGGGSRPDPFEVNRLKPLVPDGGVREAMRALRAAAMSEYAVAA